MIDVEQLQFRLGVTADGIAGVGTFTALFKKIGAKSEVARDLAFCAARHFADYGLMDSSLRLSHFLAQTGHESAGFRYMNEIWGPTPAQKRYEGRVDLGNLNPGDGFRYRGRGPIQITGRKNYRKFGPRIGIDIETYPEVAAYASVGLWLALEYWKDRNLNALADRDDVVSITAKINGGTNGLEDRRLRVSRMKAMLP